MKGALRVTSLILLVVLVGGAVWVWPDVPDRIPLHFGLDGRPDRWGERSVAGWFAIPAVGVGLWALLLGTRTLIRRWPGSVNLPGRQKLSDLPERAREPILRVMDELVLLLQVELLAVLLLIQAGSWRSALGGDPQPLVLTALGLALLSSPFLLAIFFLRLQPAVDDARRLADSRGVTPSGGPGRD